MGLSKDDFGKLVKEARKIKSEKIGKRYTQLMLAKDINKSQGYIGDIESGRTYPTIGVLNDIADACNLDFSFFNPIQSDIVVKIITKKYPKMDNDNKLNFSKYIIKLSKYETMTYEKVNKYINYLYDEYTKGTPVEEVHLPKFTYTGVNPTSSVYEDYLFYNCNTDVKTAMECVLSQSGLMLNGELLSDESKIALANAIKLGLEYAEQLQNKEKPNNK